MINGGEVNVFRVDLLRSYFVWVICVVLFVLCVDCFIGIVCWFVVRGDWFYVVGGVGCCLSLV